MPSRPLRLAVVGHVEHVEFAVVPRLPAPGEIVHASETFAVPAGGGAVAAVQMAKLAGAATLLTALGDDPLGAACARHLREEHGVTVHQATRPTPQRRCFTHLDAGSAERTITVLGDRLVPHGDDDLPYGALDGTDGVYLTGGDATALRRARAAHVLVATPRADQALLEAGVRLDVLVRSASDPGEALDPRRLDPPPRLVVSTEGPRGGRWAADDGTHGRWEAAPLPAPPVDAYGCGDAFAAGLTAGLAARLPLGDALGLAARCGAAALTGRGPYPAQLRLDPPLAAPPD